MNCWRRFFYRNRWTELPESFDFIYVPIRSGSFIDACSTSLSTIGSPRSSNLIVFFLFESSSKGQALKINEKRTLPTFELFERVRLASSSCQFRFAPHFRFTTLFARERYSFTESLSLSLSLSLTFVSFAADKPCAKLVLDRNIETCPPNDVTKLDAGPNAKTKTKERAREPNVR